MCFLVNDDVYLINWRTINDMALFAFNINEYLHFVYTMYLCVSCECHMIQLVLYFFVMEAEGIYCEVRTGLLNIRVFK
jgi:hypothetical protein